MKKILLTTTVLTLIAGAAAAGVTVTADGRLGVANNGSVKAIASKNVAIGSALIGPSTIVAGAPMTTIGITALENYYDAQTTPTTRAAALKLLREGKALMGQTAKVGSSNTFYRYQVHFNASGTTDGGLNFGANLWIRDQNGYTAARVVGSSVSFGNDMATVYVGNNYGAIVSATGTQSMQLVGATGMSFQSYLGGAGYTDKSYSGHGAVGLVRVDANLGAAKVSISGGKNNATEIAVRYKFGDVTIGLGHTSAKYTAAFAGARTAANYLTASFSAGPAKINATYASLDGPNSWAVGATVPVGSGNVNVYAMNANKKNGYGIGYAQSLGGGATVAAGFEKVAATGATNAEVGVKFNF